MKDYENLLKKTLDLLWTELTELEQKSKPEAAKYIVDTGITTDDLNDLGFSNIANAYQEYLEGGNSNV